MNSSTERVGAISTEFLASYASAASGYDEMVDAKGNVRAHWQIFAEHFSQRPSSEHTAQAEKLARLVRENGIAEDLFAETPVSVDPWRVDLIPLIFSDDEWQWLEKAIIQRASLFENILNDVYGPQNLIATGKIPHQLVLNDPSFLRPLKDIERGQGRLTFYAADLARGADGNWRIIDSHGETVAGSGFALANRVIHSRVMNDLFGTCNARRLSYFFDGMQDALHSRAGRDDTAIGLLTPGPHHADYFGHAYLARYLGLLLVEGGDLRVVGNHVYVKTLEGLQPLDMILRCVDASMADPLELDPGGYLGPPGFVQAIRTDPNLVTNMLGTAIIENRGLGPYMAELCQDVLGEPLDLWDTPRWWLGDEKARQHVLQNLNNLVIRPVQEGTGRPGRGGEAIIPAEMSNDELDSLRERIALHGHAYAAEEPVHFATLPSWTAEGLRPQPYAVRLYAARIDGKFQVMPGGIALDVEPNACVALHSPEGYSRDVWVVADGQVSQPASRLFQHLEKPKISRGSKGLRSRVADNLFWLGRYVERADWTMRLLRSALNRMSLDNASVSHREAAIKALNILLAKDSDVVSLQQKNISIEPLARALLYGRTRSYGVVRTLDQMHHTASLIRDRLSVELWHTLQTFRTNGSGGGEIETANITSAFDYLDEGIATFAAFNGMAAENMTRNYGWTFMEIGRRLERALNLTEQLQALFGERDDEALEAAKLTFALEASDSTLTYRSRYLLAPALPLVLDLLAADENNPRSIIFQLEAISRNFDALPQTVQDPLPQSEERKLILDMITRVKLTDMFALSASDASEAGHETLTDEGPGTAREPLQTLFTQLAIDLPRLSDAITRRYFSLTEDAAKRIKPRLRTQP